MSLVSAVLGLAGLAFLTPAPPVPHATMQGPATHLPLAHFAADTAPFGEHSAAVGAGAKPDQSDPATLINLGIAHAQRGNEAAARTMFEAAMRAPVVVELETADGLVTDSRRLARRALRMLARGEFRSPQQAASQLSFSR